MQISQSNVNLSISGRTLKSDELDLLRERY